MVARDDAKHFEESEVRTDDGAVFFNNRMESAILKEISGVSKGTGAVPLFNFLRAAMTRVGSRSTG